MCPSCTARVHALPAQIRIHIAHDIAHTHNQYIDCAAIELLLALIALAMAMAHATSGALTSMLALFLHVYTRVRLESRAHVHHAQLAVGRCEPPIAHIGTLCS